MSSSIRSAQTSSGSPIETHTSVSSTSQPRDRLLDVLGDRDPPAASRRRSSRRHVDQLAAPATATSARRSARPCPSFAPDDQVAVGHVEARVAEVAERHLLERLVEVLAHRQEVGEHLRRVPLVGEAVVDRHAGPLRQLVGDRLAEAAVLDRVVHAAEHARRVLDRLLVAHVRAARADERHVRALVVGGDLERAARARRVLLEDQRDLPARRASAPRVPSRLAAFSSAERSIR